ncbi:MAG: hypothetical protein J1F23_06025 [Oscillospiraceae bacterium]|nr:hypothetical protein [Oscillospiraceae bacterium]
MTEEEYRAEQAEAERLRRQINDVINRINYTNQENAELEAELEVAIENVGILIGNCGQLDNEVFEEMGWLSGVVGEADISTKEVFQALNELTVQYFSFKSISTASKNVTQYNDEYYTKYSYYNELRRISLGYVIGLDSNIINNETMRKKVEKAYLQNTEYWLAYCIAAVMLWANKEKEAAQRAMSKSLSINYFNSCLFYLLINLRFNRIDAAKKWYVNYLDRADMNNLGEEWQYLLQAYLFGAFGADEEFQEIIAKCFQSMLAQVEVTTVDFAKKFTQKALEFAELYVHKTNYEFTILGRTCDEYPQMKDLLSTAEKNIEIAKYYDGLAEAEITETIDLPQRIENVLYSLVNDYDEEELKVVQKIKYNEAIISAKGDVATAQANYNAIFEDRNKKKNLGDLLLSWAFADDTAQTDVSVKRFSISFMKEAIAKGFEQFVEKYRAREKEKYSFNIDECILECNENDYSEAEKTLDKYYDKNKLKDTIKDKQVLIYSGLCGLSLLLLLILFAYFSPVILTFGILIGLAGSFLLWRRIVDMGKILKEKKRKGKLLLKQALDELKQWRVAYKEADEKHTDMLKAIDRF